MAAAASAAPGTALRDGPKISAGQPNPVVKGVSRETSPVDVSRETGHPSPSCGVLTSTFCTLAQTDKKRWLHSTGGSFFDHTLVNLTGMFRDTVRYCHRHRPLGSCTRPDHGGGGIHHTPPAFHDVNVHNTESLQSG